MHPANNAQTAVCKSLIATRFVDTPKSVRKGRLRHSMPAWDFEWGQVTLRFSTFCMVEGCDNLH